MPKRVYHFKMLLVFCLVLQLLSVSPWGIPFQSVSSMENEVPLEYSSNQVSPSAPLPESVCLSTTIEASESAVITPGEPEPLWNKTHGTAEWEGCEAVIERDDGGFICVGNIGGESATEEDIWILRVDSAGNQIWNKTVDLSIYEMAKEIISCSDGGFAIGGRCYFGARLAAFIVKFNSSDEMEWTKRYYDNDYGYYGNDLIQCSDGGFALTGIASSTSYQEALIIRTDASGNTLWTQTYGESTAHRRGNAIIESSEGKFVVAGQRGTYSEAYTLLFQTSASGTLIWDHLLNFDSEEQALDVVEYDNGDFLFVGESNGQLLHGDVCTIIRTSKYGNFRWQRYYKTALRRGYSVANCTDGFILGGRGASNNGALQRITEDGDTLWSQGYELDYTVQQEFHDIIACSSGGFLAVGWSDNQMNDGDFWLVRIPEIPIIWTQTHDTFEVEEGVPLSLTFEAMYLANPEDSWWVNDTVQFTVSSGEVCNATSLSSDTYGLQLWTNDSEDNRLDYNFTVMVTPSGPPEWVEAPSSKVDEYGTGFSYNLDATDPSGIDCWWVNDTDNFSIDEEGVIRNAVSLSIGVYPIEVSVNDTIGNTLSGEFSLTVQDTRGPIFNPGPEDQEYECGQSFEYDMNANDPSGVASWSLSCFIISPYYLNYPFFSIDSEGTIRNTTFIFPGLYYLYVHVSDMIGNFRTEEFNITVVDTLLPEWILSPRDAILNYSVPFSQSFIVWDISGINRVQVDDPDFGIVSQGLLGHYRVVNTTTLEPGAYKLVITAYDAADNSVSEEIRVTVLPPPESPPPPSLIPMLLIAGLGIGGAVAAVVVIAVLLRIRGGTRKPQLI